MMVRNSIGSDFKSTWLVSTILIVGMLPLWAGEYCVYTLFLLLPILLFNYRKIDGTCLLIILFSSLYTFFLYTNGHIYTPSSFIFDLIYPFIMYQTGVYIVKKQSSPTTTLIVLSLMAIALALPAIQHNITDVIKTGELINVTRRILNDAGDMTRSATGYGMMLAIMDGCIGVVLLKSLNKIDSVLKLIITFVSLGAIFSTVHLLNRTGIVLAGASLICAMILPPYSSKKNLYTLLSLIIFCGIAIIFLNDTSFYLDAMEMYEERDSGAGSVSSYGGRKELWEAGFSHMTSQPFGNDKGFYLNGRYRYAHNLWLDTGVRAGIICLVLLIGVGIIYIQTMLKLFRLKYFNSFEKNLLILIGIAIFMQLNTEPVMQGVPQFFFYFIFFMSTVKAMNKKYRVSHI